MALFDILMVISFIFVPLFLIKFAKVLKTGAWLSPIVLCYIVGILAGNFLDLNEGLTKTIVGATIMLAIPLLLFSTDLKNWLQYARSTIFSFVLFIVIAILVSAGAGYFCQDMLGEESYGIAAMLASVYTGGTPNMATLQEALDIPMETYITVHTAEMIAGGSYLIILTSIAKKLYGTFLKPFKGNDNFKEEINLEETDNRILKEKTISVLKAIAIAIPIVGLSVGICLLLPGSLENWEPLLFLLLTTLSIAASFSPKIRSIRGSYDFGQYLLLIFAIAVGSLAKVDKLMDANPAIILVTILVMVIVVILHLIAARIFNIDVDTAIITSTAGIYGPPFIGPVAGAMKNKEIVFSGMATSMVGLALGYYIGAGLFYLLQLF